MATAATEEVKNSLCEQEHESDSSDCEPDFKGEEFKAYLRSVEESGGYDVLDIPKCNQHCGVLPILDSYIRSHYEVFKGLAELTINENNQLKKTNYELVRIVKVNSQLCAGEQYYLTFIVKNNDDPEKNTFICRGHVFECWSGKRTVGEFLDGNPQAGESGEGQACAESCQEDVGCLQEGSEEA